MHHDFSFPNFTLGLLLAFLFGKEEVAHFGEADFDFGEVVDVPIDLGEGVLEDIDDGVDDEELGQAEGVVREGEVDEDQQDVEARDVVDELATDFVVPVDPVVQPFLLSPYSQDLFFRNCLPPVVLQDLHPRYVLIDDFGLFVGKLRVLLFQAFHLLHPEALSDEGEDNDQWSDYPQEPDFVVQLICAGHDGEGSNNDFIYLMDGPGDDPRIFIVVTVKHSGFQVFLGRSR